MKTGKILIIISLIVSIISFLSVLDWNILKISNPNELGLIELILFISIWLYAFGGLIGIVLSLISIYYVKKENLGWVWLVIAIVTIILSIINIIWSPFIFGKTFNF